MANQLFQGFGEENFTIPNISESGIWLGNILAMTFVLPKFSSARIWHYTVLTRDVR